MLAQTSTEPRNTMAVEIFLANHGIEKHMLPQIMEFVGPQCEVNSTEVKVLQSFLFMRRFERVLGDEEVEWSGYTPAVHVRKLIEMIPKNERRRRIRRMQRIFTGLTDDEPSEEMSEAQEYFYETWVGRNTTCAKVNKSHHEDVYAYFVNSEPYTETEGSLATRLQNYKTALDAALEMLRYYNPSDEEVN